MANKKHLVILQQGVDTWNRWRAENIGIIPDLSEANLKEMDLSYTDLSGIDLSLTTMTDAILNESDLRKTDLRGADLRGADLRGTKLQDANLRAADISETYLSNANLDFADLRQANLYRAILDGANFNNVLCGQTFFTNVDLSAVRNLEMVRHRYPSIISVDTIYNSKGNISSKFLEGCGVPETMITFAKSLVGNPIEYYSCFISYSTKDEEFAHQLNDRMKREGLRVWFAPEEMKGGQKIHEQLYEAIRYHDKLILVLSEASMNSNWVQSEIRRARKHEREDKRRKLFPISLVPFGDIQKWELFEADEGVDLAREIREYYIPDFCQWKDYDKFNAEFDKLLKALRAED